MRNRFACAPSRTLIRSACIALACIAAAGLASHAQTLTTLHTFNGTDGAIPNSSLVQGTDGNFYGTTDGGGTNNIGTIFKMTPSGTLTSLSAL